MAEWRSARFTPIFDVDAEDHVRFLLAGAQGHLAHACDSDGIGIGSPWLRSAHPIPWVTDLAVGQGRQAVASQARAAQAVEDARRVETLASAVAPMANMLPLTADLGAAAAQVDLRGRQRDDLVPAHLTAMRDEFHAGIVDQCAAGLDLQQRGGAGILAAATGGSAKDIDTLHFGAAAALDGAGAIGRAGGSAHGDG